MITPQSVCLTPPECSNVRRRLLHKTRRLLTKHGRASSCRSRERPVGPRDGCPVFRPASEGVAAVEATVPVPRTVSDAKVSSTSGLPSTVSSTHLMPSGIPAASILGVSAPLLPAISDSTTLTSSFSPRSGNAPSSVPTGLSTFAVGFFEQEPVRLRCPLPQARSVLIFFQEQ